MTQTPGHLAEYLVIAGYLVTMVAIGFIFRRFNTNISDYFRSGCQGTWWLVGISSFMGSMSAVTFTGYGGSAFRAGWSVLAVYIGNVIGMALQAAVLAPLFRQLRATTFPEVMGERFGPVTQQFYAYTKVLTFTLYASLWLFGLAIFASATFGLKVDYVIPGLGAVALLYPMLGGKWAVMAADFVKGLIMMTVTILLSVYCLVEVGGFSGLFAKIEAAGLTREFAFIKSEGQFPQNLYSWQWALALMSISIVSNCGLGTAMKFFAVKDGREARKAAALSAVLMLLGTIFWFIPPITARLLFEQDVLSSALAKPEESSIAIIAVKLLPAGMLGMMVVAMFSATMSAMDVGLNGNAAILVKDIIPSVMRRWHMPIPSERRQLVFGQIATLVFGIIIIFLARYFSQQKGAGVLDLMLNVGSILGVPLSIPTILCLFVRRLPPWSALFSVAMAAIPAIIAVNNPENWTFQERTLWSLALGTIGFLSTRAFWWTTTTEYRDRVDAMFARMRRPIDFEREVGASSDVHQLRIIGRLSLVIGGFVLLLLTIPNPWTGRAALAGLALIIGLTGVLLLAAARKRERQSQASNSIS